MYEHLQTHTRVLRENPWFEDFFFERERERERDRERETESNIR